MERKGKKFVSASNRMLIDNSAEEVCVPHFTRMVRGEKNWYRVGPGVRIAETPRQEKGFSPKSVENMANLNPWDYFMKVAGTPIYKAYKDIGAAGGWITVIQWLIWLIRGIQRA